MLKSKLTFHRILSAKARATRLPLQLQLPRLLRSSRPSVSTSPPPSISASLRSSLSSGRSGLRPDLERGVPSGTESSWCSHASHAFGSTRTSLFYLGRSDLVSTFGSTGHQDESLNGFATTTELPPPGAQRILDRRFAREALDVDRFAYRHAWVNINVCCFVCVF